MNTYGQGNKECPIVHYSLHPTVYGVSAGLYLPNEDGQHGSEHHERKSHTPGQTEEHPGPLPRWKPLHSGPRHRLHQELAPLR